MRISAVFTFALMFVFATAGGAFADAAKGENLFNDKKCTACHKFGKKVMGPDLDGISKRANAEWLKKWLTDAQGTWDANEGYTKTLKGAVNGADRAKTKHKAKPLTPDEVNDIADFLMTK